MQGPNPPLTQPRPAEIVEDSKALNEAAAFAGNIDLADKEKLAAFNKLDRDDRVDGHFHRITVCGIYFVALLCAAMFLTLVFNKIAPDRFRYLSNDDQSGIYQFLFTGTLGGLITGFGKRFLGK